MKETIRVLIVEDQLLVAQGIAGILQKHGIETTGICERGEDVLHAVQKSAPDLILMDIELAGKVDGITAARMLGKQFDIPVIYLSEHVDHKTVDRAKATTPANYLAKPFNEADLIRAINIAFHNANAYVRNAPVPNPHVFLRTENQSYVKLAYDEILYLKAARAYCELKTTTRVLTFSNSMNHIFEQLDNGHFIRVHRSYVVNYSMITGLKGNTIIIGSDEVPMSREYRDTLMHHLKLVM